MTTNFKHGKNFEIGEYCLIEHDVVIGDNVRISDYVKIPRGSVIGNNVIIGSYVRLGMYCNIGNGVHIKMKSTISPDVIVEDGAFIGPGVMTLHDTAEGDHNPCRINKNAYIGACAIVMPGVIIGENSILGAGALATKSIPDNSVAVGSPARVIRKR